MNIVHITPHLGGGVKTVLLGWAKEDKENKHIFLSLGYTDNEVKETFLKLNIALYDNLYKDYDFISELVFFADVVVIHYWNFPPLIHLLLNSNIPECRVITWCHNSGFHAPYTIPKGVVEYSDKFIFTSPISYNLGICKEYPPDKFDCIWSTGGVDKYQKIQKKRHEGFNILYIGTLDFAKLRNDFVYICSEILEEIPEAIITVCGNGSSMKEIEYSISDLELQDRIKLEGLVEDIKPYLQVADVFLYPLEPTHYGTAEQILGEVMACGIVPIVFNNACEMEIVEDGVTGFVVSTIQQCIDRVKELYIDSEDGITWSQLTLNASLSALERYSIKTMVKRLNILFKESILSPKKKREWCTSFEGVYGIGTVTFLESLNEQEANIFHNYISYERQLKTLLKSSPQWDSDSKGSIKQYLKYFPEDVYLNKFKKLMGED